MAKIVWEQLTQNFVTALPASLTETGKRSRIDIVLPCYNPYEGWEQQLIENIKSWKRCWTGMTFALS